MGTPHGTRIAVNCQWCGTTKLLTPGDLRKSGVKEQGIYCSRQCAGKSQVFRFTAPPATKAEKIRANGLVNMRIRRGAMIRPSACTECGKPGKVDAHHDDYAKPAEVEFLCRSCHMKRHIKPSRKAS